LVISLLGSTDIGLAFSATPKPTAPTNPFYAQALQIQMPLSFRPGGQRPSAGATRWLYRYANRFHRCRYGSDLPLETWVEDWAPRWEELWYLGLTPVVIALFSGILATLTHPNSLPLVAINVLLSTMFSYVFIAGLTGWGHRGGIFRYGPDEF